MNVIRLLDETRDRGAEITANRLLALVRVFFNWLVARGVVETSPVTGVKAPTAERSRDRVLGRTSRSGWSGRPVRSLAGLSVRWFAFSS